MASNFANLSERALIWQRNHSDLQHAPGRLRVFRPISTTTGLRETSLYRDWQAKGKPDGGLIPGSAELEPGSGVRSPKPEPRWNADRWPPGDPGAAVPAGMATRALRLSAFRLRIFSLVLSVRHPWQAALANASTSICLLPLGTE